MNGWFSLGSGGGDEHPIILLNITICICFQINFLYMCVCVYVTYLLSKPINYFGSVCF